MQRRLPWFWIVVAGLLLLAPTPAGRLLLDVLGGITLTLLLLPLLLGFAGLVVWQLVQRRMRTCQVCGFTSMGLEQCPACGALFTDEQAADGQTTSLEIDPRDVTIDVEVLNEDP
jgi:hypothetical protein